jgi:hypothetical protein
VTGVIRYGAVRIMRHAFSIEDHSHGASQANTTPYCASRGGGEWNVNAGESYSMSGELDWRGMMRSGCLGPRRDDTIHPCVRD